MFAFPSARRRLAFFFRAGGASMGVVLLFRWRTIDGVAVLLTALLMGLWILYRLDKSRPQVEPPV